MAPEVAKLIEAGLALESDERAVLANALLDSLDVSEADEEEVAEAWSDEIGSRVDDILNGNVDLVDADDHYARLRAELVARRT